MATDSYGHPSHAIMRITNTPVSATEMAIVGGIPRLVTMMRAMIATMMYCRVIS
jgi:hypothetical protein